MILTTCAACATPLAHTAPRCVRCQTRYCNKTCQMDHWRRGHKQMCKKIHRGGNAEQYHADKKYKEAVAVAVEKCADDTKGQTCYICTQALHWKTKEGLVRGCSCRGTAGFVHVSCLAEQAKILFAEAEENNLGDEAYKARWDRWHMCSLCEQHYHGVVKCALGWACWKTYVGRAEVERARRMAVNLLGNGLASAGHDEAALPVREAELAMERRFGAPEQNILIVQSNLASTYSKLGHSDKAQRMRRDVYSTRLKLLGEEHTSTLRAANNYAMTLINLGRFEEAKRLLRKTTPVARRVLGTEHELSLSLREDLSRATLEAESSAEDKREALRMLEDVAGVMRRVMGPAHPDTVHAQRRLEIYRQEYPPTP